MEIRPIGKNEIHFPIKRGKATKEEKMIAEPTKEGMLPPKWTDTTIILIPKESEIKNNDK